MGQLKTYNPIYCNDENVIAPQPDSQQYGFQIYAKS